MIKNFDSKIAVWLLVAFCALGLNTVAFADDAKKAEEIAKITEEAQATLNGFTWNLDVTTTGGNPEERTTTKDSVIFKNNKLNSAGLSEKGFGTSNYSLTVGDDKVPVFETMQRNEVEATVFWRGELVDGKIRGVISVQEKGKPATAFSFRGEKAGEAAEIPAEKVEPQPEPVIEETPPAPAVEEVAAEVVSDVLEPATDVVTEPVEAVESVVTDVVTEATPAVEAVAPDVTEQVAAPMVEEPKSKKQPWWAAKKN